MKRIITITLLTTALLAAPVVQAASYQDRAMATGAVVGATTGAVAGSSSDQAVQGAIFGAVLGTIAGAVIASQYQEQVIYVAPHQPRVHHKPAVARYEHRVQRPAYSHDRQSRQARSNNRQYSRYADNHNYGHERRD